MNWELPATTDESSKRVLSRPLTQSASERKTEKHSSITASWIIVHHIRILHPSLNNRFDEWTGIHDNNKNTLRTREVVFSKVTFFTVSLISLWLVCLNATHVMSRLSNALWVMQTRLHIDFDPSCPTLRRPRAVRLKAEDFCFCQVTAYIPLFSCHHSYDLIKMLHSSVRPGQTRRARWLTGEDITMRRGREYRERYEYLSRWHKRIL